MLRRLAPVLLLALAPLAACDRAESRAQASSMSAVTGPCGAPGEPDCPLQAWMKATLKPYLVAADGPDVGHLREAMEKLAAAAPAAYPEWGPISRRAAERAAAGDLAGVNETCANCHNAYRARYKAEMRAQRLF